jgi:hypothetical protein
MSYDAESQRKYFASEKGRAARIRAQARYYASAKGKANIKRKAMRKRWRKARVLLGK